MALLHFLVQQGWSKLVVCHVNHRLRGKESDRDEAFVKQTAKRLGLKCETKRIDVASLARRNKESLETAGREARRGFFAAMARKHRCGIVFLAHHADDQAETVLHNLFRGAGLAGASGMLAASSVNGKLMGARPLLDVSRREIDEFVAARRIVFVEDSSNQSRLHTRNRIRNELMPLAHDIFRRDISPIVLRFSQIALRDTACLDRLAKDFASEHRLLQTDGSLRVIAALGALDPALQARVLAEWLRASCGRSPDRCEIDSAISMLRTDGPAKINLRGGLCLRRRAGRVWVESQRRKQTRS